MSNVVQIITGWRGVDYSFARPDPATMAANGITFACRYLAYQPNDKVIQVPEISALHEVGIAVILNWEQTGGDVLRGADVGAAHGQEAKIQAEARCYPYSLPIVVSVDVGVSTAQMPVVEQYLRAFAAAIPPYGFGVYGGTTVMSHVADICDFGWQANASSWSPYSANPSSIVKVRQNSQNPDHQTDPNVCVVPFMAWLPNSTSTTQENDMPYIINAVGRNPALMDASYATGISLEDIGAFKESGIPYTLVSDATWLEKVATSDLKKAADAAMVAMAAMNAPAPSSPVVEAPHHYSGSFTMQADG